MAKVTAAQVKELRERTGLGMMECKKALVATEGNIDQAIEDLRKSGQAKAEKKAGRVAAEGVVIAKVSDDGKSGILIEINAETDFVTRDDNFMTFANKVGDVVLAGNEDDVAKVAELAFDDGTVETARQALVQKIGENVQLRRVSRLTGETLGAYIHGSKIGVLVSLKGGDAALGKDVAMHVAAVDPMVVSSDEVPADVLEKEKDIIRSQPDMEGKPAEIVEKILVGRVNKYLKEVSLNDQPFVKDPDQTVGKLVSAAGAEVQSFARLVVGEGIEKEEVDFAAEVQAQAGL